MIDTYSESHEGSDRPFKSELCLMIITFTDAFSKDNTYIEMEMKVAKKQCNTTIMLYI